MTGRQPDPAVRDRLARHLRRLAARREVPRVVAAVEDGDGAFRWAEASGLALRSPQWPIEYGMGLMRFGFPRMLSPFAPVPPLLGHTGSTGAWLVHCPARNLYFAGTVDQAAAGPVPFRFVPRLLRAVERRA